MTRLRRELIAVVIWILAAIAFTVGLTALSVILDREFPWTRQTNAQEIHQHSFGGMSAPPNVDEFISRWKQPDKRDANGNRIQGCCNKQDCYPTVIRLNKMTGQFEGLLKTRYYINGQWSEWQPTTQWATIPATKLEENYMGGPLGKDGLESPNGESFMCTQGVSVLCAVRGGGM